MSFAFLRWPGSGRHATVRSSVLKSNSKMAFLPPASMAMFAIVMRSSIERLAAPGPSNCIARYVAPSKPISPMQCRMMSLAITPGCNLPSRRKCMVSGTLSSNLPVPMTNPASVLPMPVANSLNAPAMQVCESVPNRRSEEHTSELQSLPPRPSSDLLEQQFTGAHDEPRIGVADAGGELVERARHAGVRVGSEQEIGRAHV